MIIPEWNIPGSDNSVLDNVPFVFPFSFVLVSDNDVFDSSGCVVFLWERKEIDPGLIHIPIYKDGVMRSDNVMVIPSSMQVDIQLLLLYIERQNRMRGYQWMPTSIVNGKSNPELEQQLVDYMLRLKEDEGNG